jgi:hypothetical protein
VLSDEKGIISRSHRPSDVTCVTALYNIGRHDRSFDDYKAWTVKTLEIPLPIIVFCKSEDASWIREARGSRPTLIIEEKNIPLESLVEKVKEILPVIGRGRGDVEWVNERYILTTFSKAVWLQRAMDLNPFQSSRFFWIDAGVSRFFTGGQPNAPFALLQATDLEPDRMYLSKTWLAGIENIDASQAIGSQHNFFMGGVFGGYAAPTARVSAALLDFLHTEMLGKGRVDNEQVALGLIYVAHKDWFHILDRDARGCNVVCL